MPRQSCLSLAAAPLAVIVMVEQRMVERSEMGVAVMVMVDLIPHPIPFSHPDVGTALDLEKLKRKPGDPPRVGPTAQPSLQQYRDKLKV